MDSRFDWDLICNYSASYSPLVSSDFHCDNFNIEISVPVMNIYVILTCSCSSEMYNNKMECNIIHHIC